MITEKNNVFYCDCGFSFLRGNSGAHDCAVGLRNKLAKSEARCAALAAENEGLKAVIAENWNMRDVLRQLVSARPGGVYFNKWEPVILKALNETPTTDAFLAEVRAQGVEMFANEMHADISGDDAREFAAQLRKGVQS